MNEHRAGTTYFVTLECLLHHPLLAPPGLKQMLISALRETKRQFGLSIGAYVILDDHLHLVLIAPTESDFHGPMNYLRARFVRAWRDDDKTRNEDMFWEHGFRSRLLVDADKLRQHVDYIHYDPVRHGLCERAYDYRWSSLRARVEQGHYPEDWAVMGPPASISHVLAQRDRISRLTP